MAQKVALFAALFFVALVAGAAFAIWIDYDPDGMGAVLYAAKMQHAIRVFTAPLPTIVVAGVVSTVGCAVLARRERPVFYLLLAASACIVAVALVTVLGNVPINNQIMTWDASAPPSNWKALAERWWRLQTVRTIAAIAGSSALTLVALRRRDVPVS